MEFEFNRPDRASKCTWKPNAADSPHRVTCRQPTDWKNVMPNILHAIGQTPMVKLNRLPKSYGINCEVFAKCEFMNPGGSVKDRIAFSMIENAEKRGILRPGCTIIEPTSGNTGVGLALAAAAGGYPCIIVMPERFSEEKSRIAQALGAKIVRSRFDAAWDGPEGPFGVAQTLQRETPNSVILDQFANPDNPLVHYNQTSIEIWEQCNGKIDYLVGGIGTGGTITGIGRKFRELSPSTKIIVASPTRSFRDNKCLDPEDQIHHVEGIGISFVATTTDLNIVDMQVNTEQKECLNLARELSKQEGLLCGGSSGAALSAALNVAKDLPANKRVVVILPDTIYNYMTQFVADSWMEWKNFLDPPKPLKTNEWWWDLPVSEISLNKPIVLPNDSTCEKALTLLPEEGIHRVAIVDENGCINGFVTRNKLLSGLISGEIKSSDLAMKALIK
ncbi:cystathionine beta-synthase-like [Phymastichus coffea]|uniref:cystathionine beta-synthase-like n=1 Tax=Phymastichus coffea TaxID=108790 RepID=UPI00273C683E|nr:cystathionine beta-synthase-like [Phymastichus coffea]